MLHQQVAKPKELPHWISIALPLKLETWLITCLCFVCCMLFAWAYTFFHPGAEFTFSQGFIFISGAFLEENFEFMKKLRCLMDE